MIIADQPLDGIVPLYRDSEGNILTQFEGPIAEKCGLLKMDFLGLRTLTTLTRSLDLEKQTPRHPAGEVGRRIKPSRRWIRTEGSTSKRSTLPIRWCFNCFNAAKAKASSNSNPAACRIF